MSSPRGSLPVVDGVPSRLLIGGSWVDALADSRFAVRNPATGEVIVDVSDARAEDATRALDAAVAAQTDWAATPSRERGEVLSRAFAIIRARADEVAHVITLEMGKPLRESRAEVAYGSEFLRWFAEEAVRSYGRYTTSPSGSGRALVTHRPVGPVYLITPWNFPLAMATRKIGPALAAGCTVVIKPAELTPLTTLMLADILTEAGLPPGVVNVVTTTRSADLSAPILEDGRLRKLSFTGSTPVGARLLAQSAPRILRTSMELGGNAPFIVFDDADIDAAVEGALAAKFRNGGQACTAANRFLVQDSVAAEFTERFAARVAALRVGPGTDEGVDVGPLIDDRAVSKVTELVADAVARGAEVLTGGSAWPGAGSFYEPTVLTKVDETSRVAREEIFGPIAAISTFRTEAEAVATANATEFGLAAYAYTRDLNRAHRLIELLETGMLGVNTGVISDPSSPFGGVKQSGLGREGGAEGIHEYLEPVYALLDSPFDA